ncbi:metallophosphoesterase [candidate division KSB1 bacterium]|nr:metallophosphoesterase [candidate division KSB1 bacterium]
MPTLRYQNKVSFALQNLSELYDSAPTIPLDEDEEWVIMSDWHLGNGGDRDDFKKNSDLVPVVLKDYYLKKGFNLILNGDIEELQKFSLKKIKKQYTSLYTLLNEFQKNGQYVKLVGNHDFDLFFEADTSGELLFSAVKLSYDGDIIFIFHGHQASNLFEKYNDLLGFFFRYLVKPIGIKNVSTAYHSKRKFSVEKKVYQFSAQRKIVSIIGHTHRPLFESMSKIDTLKFRIEQSCREYPKAHGKKRQMLEEEIKKLKIELNDLYQKGKKLGLKSSLYNTNILIPCIFNSGCAIGKRGVTAIEIRKGNIYLVYWFNIKKSKKYFHSYEHYEPRQLENTDYYRMVLNRDHLDYIFTRINLLA